MRLNSSRTGVKSEFNLTELSTLSLLIGVGVTCAGLWAVIASTIGG